MNTDYSSHTPIRLRTIVKAIIIPLFFVVLCHAQVNKTVPPNMVLVEGGTFQMGNDHGYAMEKPVHRVSIYKFSIWINMK
jgi:formylglycine-generating enzyme required for sulfatase activity